MTTTRLGGSKRPVSRPPRARRRVLDKLVRYTLLLLGVCLFVLGLIGFLIQNDRASPPLSVWQAGYKAVQLFVLDSGAEGPDNVYLVLARLAAVGFVFLGVGKVLATIYHDAFDDWRLRWVRRHAVICGLGQVGIQLCRDLRARRKPTSVVAIERDETNANIQLARELGAIVLIGDARDPELLRAMRLHRARLIFAVAGSDSTNVEIAIRGFGFVPRTRRPEAIPRAGSAFAGPPAASPSKAVEPPAPPTCHCETAEVELADQQARHCYVHIADPARTDLLSRHPVFAHRFTDIEVRLLNVFERSAWQLVDEHLSRHRPGPMPAGGSSEYQAAHYAIVGFGQMGQAVALTAARLGQYENRKRLRLTILDDAIDSAQAQFLARYPRFCPEPAAAGAHGLDLDAFDPVADRWASQRYRPARRYWADDPRAIEYACNAEFLPIAGGVEADALADALADRFSRPDVRPALIVSFDEDSRNFDAALALRARLQARCPELPIYVWLPTQPGLTQWLDHHQSVSAAGTAPLVAFGACEDSCRLERVFRPEIEFFARGFHEDWRRRHEPQAQPWEELPEGLRHSNYLAAEHVAVKLRTVGCEIVCAKSCWSNQRVEAFRPEELSLLAEIEHNRWLCERLIDGWSYGNPPKEKRWLLKQSPSLVPWECFDAEHHKDFAQMELIPHLVRQLPLGCHAGRPARWCVARA